MLRVVQTNKVSDSKLKCNVLNLIAASTQFPVSSVSIPVYGGKNKQNCFYNNLLDGLLLTLIVK